MPRTDRLEDPYEIKAVKELQELYQYKFDKGDYKACDTLISVFCILNKHLTTRTGWQIRFDGSIADDLYNIKQDGWVDKDGKVRNWTI